ncbi:hypothetical protein DYB26_008193 [Aphanomyces astaci]|uniref:Rad4 beta-hairpin domain-containing protein n=1 Tax=Aphanomyces astaci TaxID=112090 RepID=A0A418FYU4_APHAT|nr:hypothetical protein DYB26_008193 [Aphanomyces astaci]
MEIEWGDGSPFSDFEEEHNTSHHGDDDNSHVNGAAANNEDASDDDDAWEDVGSMPHNDGGGVLSDNSDHMEDADGSNDMHVEHLPEDWDALNAALNAQAAAEGDGKRTGAKPKLKRLTKVEKSEWIVQRQAHLVCLLAREVHVNRAINDVTVQCLLRSIVPAAVDVNLSTQAHQGVVYAVQTLMRWFRLAFRRRPYAANEGQGAIDFDVTSASLLRAFFHRQGHDHEMVALFTALCRSFNISTRYTVSLDIPYVSKRNASFDHWFGVDVSSSNDTVSQKLSDRTSMRSWCEVFSEASHNATTASKRTTSSWVHVDILRSIVNQPLEVGRVRGRGAVMPHIVSLDDQLRAVDVSRTYAVDWARTQPLRCNEVWWARQLRVGDSNANPIDVANDKLPLPTSVHGFRNHMQYCLEQHLGMYEWVRPRKPVGVFKGLPVFERCNVHTLQSAHRWLRQGRVVLEAEDPCKYVARRQQHLPPPPSQTSMYANPVPFSVATAVVAANKDNDDEEEEGGDKQLPLYGLWQTDKYISPPVVDGRIPKNEHGNVEVWSQAHLPQGSVHIRLPRAKVVAAQLGVDFAPAMVGWELRNGRNVPVFDGIVVCEDAAEMIEDAHAVLEQDIVEKAIAKHRKEIAKRWAIFVKKLLLRKRLRDEYG